MNEQQNPFYPIMPKMVVTIVNWNDVEKVKEIMDFTFFQSVFIINGMGTCKSELLDVLGIGTEEKALIAAFQPNFRVHEVMRDLKKRMEFNKPGRGIAFTVPLSGISQPAVKTVLNDERFIDVLDELDFEKKERINQLINCFKENPGILKDKQALERMKSNMENDIEKPQNAGFRHNLILAVINKGFTDDLMDAVREAGARGGTVIQARHSGYEDDAKFFGISIHAEKEVVAIITEREQKTGIMKAINQQCGPTTDAAGFVISVPVDAVAGIATAAK